MSDEADAGVLWEGEVPCFDDSCPVELSNVRVRVETYDGWPGIRAVGVTTDEEWEFTNEEGARLAGEIARLLADAKRERDEAVNERIRQSVVAGEQIDTLRERLEVATEALRAAMSWAAGYPLQGQFSDADRQAASDVYLQTENALKGSRRG